MDQNLRACLDNLDAQNEVLGKARNAYLAKEAERKHFEAKLIKAAEGKSQAEKTVNAQATNDWLEFQQALARLEAIYEFQKLKAEILDKEFLATYAGLKSDERMIKRQGA